MRSLVSLDQAALAQLAGPWCGRAPVAPRGLAVVRDGRTLGAIAFAPADRERDLCPPASFVISALWVSPDEVREHIGTQLIQKTCAQLLLDKARCLVAYGTDGPSDCRRLPSAWLERVGFREHVGGVQWRIELSRTVPWSSVVDAAGAALRAVRSPGTPQPAGNVASRISRRRGPSSPRGIDGPRRSGN